ncbi:F-box/kelch-repeat protein At3g06240-like [Lycium barbarum]|uniref:F-box/kelch-repeat protein At3g06240-like n=1 Tax=Lycium barbarum TaxID=112863 RepID=UPI00293EDFFB|nr:F-box/kelch-repeat protein At3g06240-like [Lycium barbarum]
MAMSESAEKLPEDIIFDILTRLPAKSIGQFMCISKQWCSSLSDPKFIKAHLTFHSHKHDEVKSILISHVSRSLNTVTFNHDTHNPIDAISRKLNLSDNMWQRVVGSCNGLVLVLNEEDDIFLINPSTLEYRGIPNSRLALPKHGTSSTYALGYDVVSDDYKLVTLSHYEGVSEGDLFCTYADVYSLRMGLWRRLESLSHHGGLYTVLGFLYMGFALVPIPTILDEDHLHFSDFVALRGCIYMLANTTDQDKNDVWMMKEYGFAGSWTKFSVTQQSSISGFTPICFMSDDNIVLDASGKEKFFIYNKKEEHWREMNVDGINARTFMESFVSPMIGKGSVEPRLESTTEPATPAPEFDTARSSRLIAAAGKRQKTLGHREETKEKGEERCSDPEGRTRVRHSYSKGDASPEEAPLKRPRRSGPSSDIEAEQRAESAPNTEATMATSPLSDGDQATSSEAPAYTEAARALPASPTPAPKFDNLDEISLL